MNTPAMNSDDLRSGALSVEDVISTISGLVLERQALRGANAEASLLEHNRVALVTAHHQLSLALIERHCPPGAQAAA